MRVPMRLLRVCVDTAWVILRCDTCGHTSLPLPADAAGVLCSACLEEEPPVREARGPEGHACYRAREE